MASFNIKIFISNFLVFILFLAIWVLPSEARRFPGLRGKNDFLDKLKPEDYKLPDPVPSVRPRSFKTKSSQQEGEETDAEPHHIRLLEGISETFLDVSWCDLDNAINIDAGHVAVLASFHSIRSYNCEMKLRPANPSTQNLTLTPGDHKFSFNCHFERVEITVDGVKNTYCRDDQIPVFEAKEIIVHYYRLLMFHGGYTFIVKSHSTVDTNAELNEIDKKQCGITKSMEDQHHRIVGGQQAGADELPFNVLVEISVGGYTYRCGGALIDETHILTAAHCLYFTQTVTLITVTLGCTKPGNKNNNNCIRRLTTKYKIHENYDDWDVINDIAIVSIEPVTFTDSVRSICLPNANTLETEYVGKTVDVSGWGLTNFNGYESEKLLHVDLEGIGRSDCEERWQKGINWDDFFLLPTQFCAYKDGKDSCTGDSGGPLFFQASPDDPYTIVGVVSYGYECAYDNIPGVYTYVSAFIHWIDENLSED